MRLILKDSHPNLFLYFSHLNSQFQTGLNNPLDDAICAYAKKAKLEDGAEKKIDEIPYDFVRKCLSVVTDNTKGKRTLITKGALENILNICGNGTDWRPGVRALDPKEKG